MNTANTGKTKLATLSILATLAYCLMILSSFTQEWDDFRLGFEEGKSTNLQTYFVDLKAKQSFSAFPDSITNNKTGNYVLIRHDKAQVRAEVPKDSKKLINKYQFILIILSFLVFFIAIYIPIQFFKLMKSLMHEVVFDKKNISHVRKIGIFLFIFYISNLVFNQVTYLENITLFDFEGYNIQRESSEFIWLFLGIVVMLFAEILSKGSKIQEEHDLTI